VVSLWGYRLITDHYAIFTILFSIDFEGYFPRGGDERQLRRAARHPLGSLNPPQASRDPWPGHRGTRRAPGPRYVTRPTAGNCQRAGKNGHIWSALPPLTDARFPGAREPVIGSGPRGDGDDQTTGFTDAEGALRCHRKTGTAWVPGSEQRSQGGLINAFVLKNRVLDDDPFFVDV
jgi:hypothetical protein